MVPLFQYLQLVLLWCAFWCRNDILSVTNVFNLWDFLYTHLFVIGKGNGELFYFPIFSFLIMFNLSIANLWNLYISKTTLSADYHLVFLYLKTLLCHVIALLIKKERDLCIRSTKKMYDFIYWQHLPLFCFFLTNGWSHEYGKVFCYSLGNGISKSSDEKGNMLIRLVFVSIVCPKIKVRKSSKEKHGLCGRQLEQ